MTYIYAAKHPVKGKLRMGHRCRMLNSPDGARLSGEVIVRFSDGTVAAVPLCTLRQAPERQAKS